jgi:AcrR family transcriptional regulator
LAAAFARFSRYGYRRTSLEEIAEEAGISRAALYLHFPNKEAIFRALAFDLHLRAQAAAERAAAAPGPLEARLAAVLEARAAHFFDVVHASPHAAELLGESSRQGADVSEAFRRRFLRVLRRPIAEAEARGEIRAAAAGLDAGSLAALLLDAAKGLEKSGAGAPSPARYRRRLRQMVRAIVRGLSH